MESSFHGLPPSKRFKLLQQQEALKRPDPQFPNCLPAKKRIKSQPQKQQQQLPATSYCLPAKKRVWAPHPLSPIEHQEDNDDDKSMVENSKLHDPINSEGDEEVVEEPKIVVDLEEKVVVEEEEEEEDGVICAVCQSTDGDPMDPIVFCDGCDLMVHASCYGSPLNRSIPEGDWFCLRCKSKEDEEPNADCCLCQGKGGATKPSTDGRWAHITCALLVPEVFFRDPEGRDGADLSRVPTRRWEGVCYVCGSDSGCVIDCSEPKCGLMFHVSCGLEADLCVEYREGKGGGIVVGFCDAHTQLWKKQQATGKFKFVPREKNPKGKI